MIGGDGEGESREEEQEVSMRQFVRVFAAVVLLGIACFLVCGVVLVFRGEDTADSVLAAAEVAAPRAEGTVETAATAESLETTPPTWFWGVMALVVFVGAAGGGACTGGYGPAAI